MPPLAGVLALAAGAVGALTLAWLPGRETLKSLGMVLLVGAISALFGVAAAALAWGH